MSLLFIRHAATHLAGTFCGQSDPPLNALGHDQLRTLLHTLDLTAIDAVYTSDLQRALTTAQAIARAADAPITLRPALREIHFGDWEALRWPEIEARNPAFAQQWLDAFPNLPAPNGESNSTFEARVLPELNHLVGLAQTQRIAVVTHAGVLRLALRTLLNSSDSEAWQRTRDYCAHFYIPTPQGETITSAPHTQGAPA